MPCGAAAEKVFAAAKITPKPDTLEQDVKATLAKVAADEVDAALVYRTDVIAAPDDVEGIDFPESAQAVNTYPIAVLTASKASGRRSGLRRLRAVARGSGRAGESRLCQALARSAYPVRCSRCPRCSLCCSCCCPWSGC